MRSFEQVCRVILQRIIPHVEERKRITNLAELIRREVENTSCEAGLDAEVRIDGSLAKDTWLSGEGDIDIFMRVSPSLSRTDFETVSLEVARKAMKGHRIVERFAEHPYIEAWVRRTRVNIVPCYRVDRGKWQSATDRTPYHTEYMRTHLDYRLRHEVRLLKKFMKGVGLYGAEAKTRGFSGMLCETLSVATGSFLNVLQDASNWKPGRVIDVERYYDGKEEEIPDLFEEPLIVIDPVDSARNVAASVAGSKLWEFVAASREFLRRPRMSFFYPPSVRVYRGAELSREIEKRGSSLLIIAFGRVEAVVDILWSQLYKTESSIENLLKTYDFNVLGSSSWSDEKNLNVILYELAPAILSSGMKRLGPPVTRKQESEEFLGKHLHASDTIAGPWIEEGRWAAEKTRRYRSAKTLLVERLSDGGRSVGVGSRVAQSLRRGFNIIVDNDINKLYGSSRQFARFLSAYMKRRPVWLA